MTLFKIESNIDEFLLTIPLQLELKESVKKDIAIYRISNAGIEEICQGVD